MRINIKIDVKGALAKGKSPEIVQKSLDRAITSATLYLTREVIKRTPQGVYGAQGGLINSIKGQIFQKGTPVVKGVIMSTSRYADVVEQGRRPGAKMPPSAVLSTGIRIVEKGQRVCKGEVAYSRLADKSRIAYRTVADGGLVRWIQEKFGVDIEKAIKLEFAVRRAIAKKGIEGVHMFERALDENIKTVQDIFNKAGFEIVKELSE